jgi:hypothetical protein
MSKLESLAKCLNEELAPLNLNQYSAAVNNDEDEDEKDEED